MADEPYFTVEELRLHAGGSSLPEAKFPAAACELKRAAVEATIERVCGTSFVWRTTVDELPGDGTYGLQLSKPYTRQLLSVSIDGIPVESLPDTVRLTVLDVVVHRRQPWASYVPVVVEYLAGATAAPAADLKEAAMEATSVRLREDRTSGVPSRALSITNEFGNVNLAAASLQRPFGIPDVDAVVLGYREAFRVPVTA